MSIAYLFGGQIIGLTLLFLREIVGNVAKKPLIDIPGISFFIVLNKCKTAPSKTNMSVEVI